MPRQSHFRYLPVLEAQRQWGLYLTDCGFTEIAPGSPYPPQRHPDAYHFDWRRGRTLAEYQVVYITRGQGTFEARGARRQALAAGDVFVLFPGVWHRYAPDPKTGWDEHWIGFNGALAERLMKVPFFRRNRPVLKVGADDALRRRFIGLVEAAERDPAGAPFSSAGLVLEILGLVQERMRGEGAGGRLSAGVREAQSRILQRAAEPIDFAALARELGASYTAFRRSFRQQTGVAPAQFQSAIRLNRARDLLAGTELTVSEIAGRVGYETVFYFSRAFKKKTGLTPKAYRQQARQPQRCSGDSRA
jgi:AraC-like DNA-binding protein